MVTRHFSHKYGWINFLIILGLVGSTGTIMYFQHKKREDSESDPKCKDAMDYQRNLTYLMLGIIAAGALGVVFVNAKERNSRA